jgi:phosphodiesterase/alkaline phosphatase D-like protein
MNRLHVKLVTTAAAVGVLLSNSIAAQSGPYSPKELPPASKVARVRINQGPELESADDTSAIVRWTSNNPGGADEHYGVVHYGTSPKELNQTAKSHIRLNRNHAYTIFRVRVEGLAPRTTYYYSVDSMEANGRSDGVKSATNQFRTSGRGERVAANRSQPAAQPR